MKIFFLLYIIAMSIFSTEEKNLNPFFFLMGKSNKLKVKSKDTQACRIKTNDIVEIENFKIIECYFLDQNFPAKLKEIISENVKKREIQIIFLRNQKEKINPLIEHKGVTYFVHSILYYKKTKSYHLELTNSKDEYYFFNFQPDQIQIETIE
jgi:hypothetical protein